MALVIVNKKGITWIRAEKKHKQTYNTHFYNINLKYKHIMCNSYMEKKLPEDVL